MKYRSDSLECNKRKVLCNNLRIRESALWDGDLVDLVLAGSQARHPRLVVTLLLDLVVLPQLTEDLVHAEEGGALAEWPLPEDGGEVHHPPVVVRSAPASVQHLVIRRLEQTVPDVISVHPIRKMFEHDLPVRVAASLTWREPQLGGLGGGVERGGDCDLRQRDIVLYCEDRTSTSLIPFLWEKSCLCFIITLHLETQGRNDIKTDLGLKARADVYLIDLHERLVQMVLHSHLESLAGLQLEHSHVRRQLSAQ